MDSQNSTSTSQVQASMDSPNSATSEELFTMFKELSEAFVKFMMLPFAILAAKSTDTGNALLVKDNGLVMAAVLASLVNLLVLVTVLQLNAETRSLTTVLVLGSSVSFLVSFVISSAIGWLTLSLLLYVFAVLAVAIINNTIKLISSPCC